MKKFVAIFLVTIMVLSLAACSPFQSKSETSSANDISTGDNSASASEKKEEYIFTYLATDGSAISSADTPVGKIIKEKFNITINLEVYPGDYNEKCALMLAAGDYPDILQLTSMDIVNKYINAGALLDIEELAKENGTNFLKRHAKSIPFWKLASDDGELYKYEFNTPNYEVVTGAALDVSVRSDVLEAQGYPELLDEDSYIEFLKKGLEQFPEINGQKTVGMTFPGAESWGIQGIVPIMYEKGGYAATGNNGAIFNIKEDRYEDYFKNKYVKSSFKFFNRLYREGLLDPECFTDLNVQTQEKMNSGRALSVWYVTWNNSTANAIFNSNGNSDMEYVIMPIMSRDQLNNNEKLQLRILDTYPHAGMGITKNSKDPERLMVLLDWVATEEGQILLGWGIEGEDYTIKEGKRVPTDAFRNGYLNTPDYLHNRGIGVFGFLGLTLALDENGQNYLSTADPSVRKFLMSERLTEVYSKYGWENINDPWVKNKNYSYEVFPTGIVGMTVVDPSSDEGKLEAKLVDFRIKNTVPLIMAKSDAEFEALYEKTMAEYNKLNPDTVINKYNEIYKTNKDKIESVK